MTYDWAENAIKLQRAIADSGKDAAEKEIKARYVQLAGVVREVEEKVERIVKRKAKSAKLKTKIASRRKR
jgi:hypothetical protein